MKNYRTRKMIVICICISLSGILFTGNAIGTIDMTFNNLKKVNTAENLNGYVDISVEETWLFLNSTANGIQIPIDVRRNDEWESYHIYTPVPENPRHYRLDLLQDETGLQEFMSLYNGKNIILYCKGGSRSAAAADILVANNYSGTIYNMVGGITAWNSEGFPTSGGAFINIAVTDAWILLNDTSNCVQIPIDVRTDFEWAEAHIDTPIPENPRHHNYYNWENVTILQNFLSFYEYNEIILYCKSGSRSASAVNILVENGFNGTIYNMLGGITDWSNTGFPTIANMPPDTPIITGPTTGKPKIEYNFTISSIDPECDSIKYYINWSDNSEIFETETYESGENVIINHTWNETGTYIIKVKSVDYYQAESDWAVLEVAMPKNKIDFLLFWLFNRCPFFERFLEVFFE